MEVNAFKNILESATVVVIILISGYYNISASRNICALEGDNVILLLQ